MKLTGSGEVQLKNGAGELIDVIKYEAGDAGSCVVDVVGGLRVVRSMVSAVGNMYGHVRCHFFGNKLWNDYYYLATTR